MESNAGKNVKLFLLLLSSLLALVSASTYVVLNKKIIQGTIKIAAGQKELQEGQDMLAQGKAKLANGEQRLSSAKRSYKSFKSAPFVLAAVLPVAGAAVMLGDNMAGKKIAEGNQQVAEGSKKVSAGEAQLQQGRLKLQRGIERLKVADTARIVFGAAAIFFILLSIILGFYWRSK